MRLTKVAFSGIGGLRDGELILPAGPVAAVAGANGTGKSKLLASLLAPWTHTIPTPVAGLDGEVHVTIFLDEEERRALERFSREMGWGDFECPAEVVHTTRQTDVAGSRFSSVPQHPALDHFGTSAPFLTSRPSMDVLYLPAERRLVAAGGGTIDLQQLGLAVAQVSTATGRSSAHNYGRLDDGEFEGFARALCVADQLEDDPDDPEPTTITEPRISWLDFKAHVDGLLAPKKLLGVTKSRPDALRIRTPDGHTHPVGDLSSGERQALFIVSRLLRAGSGHSVVIIDEPDAYLHPDLSRRLATLLGELAGEGSQLVFATHSTAILDAIPASKIVRLSHGAAPQLVANEAERLEVYRSVGFRASALTQSDLLLIPEGTTDEQTLPLLVPELAGASLRSAGGRASVLKGVATLRPYDLPVLGVVDADVLADDVPADIADRVVVWGVSDLEAVVLSDDASLDVLVNRNLVQKGFESVGALRAQLDALVLSQRDHFVAEAAQQLLRRALNWKFPSPKAPDPIQRLRDAAAAMRAPDATVVEQAVAEATSLWIEHEAAKTLWKAVRGKYVIHDFTQRCTTVTSADALLRAVAAAGPDLRHLRPFRDRVQELRPMR